MSGEKQSANRLIHAASPYLQQHAHNPVDWFPWSDQAFEKARREDKPVFLSIGYSTCHWCHVMAHESFENEQFAALLNEKFVSIKVDREELPGVDAVYMDFVQKTTGSGGWPLSVFLTPDAKPFFGGTYFPPQDMYGRPGFERILRSIDRTWRDRREEILHSADQITSLLQRKAQINSSFTLDHTMLDNAANMLKRIYDSQHGGFAAAPKFPQPGMLSFLMVYHHRTGNEEPLAMVENTLKKMAAGGIHDHLGGGFHRYSVDAQWRVPHFEKMLYDQALISKAYMQAYQITGEPVYEKVVRDTFTYILRDMTAPQGGFYSAEDADSEGVEGRFYVWTPRQIDACLNPDEAKLIKACYGVSEKGNFENGRSILHAAMPPAEAADKCGMSVKDAETVLAAAKQELFAARQKRIRPHRDEKIISGWNGLMISALACGGAVMDAPEYIRAAERCADFIIENLYRQGRLRRYYGGGRAHEYAVLNDYAFFLRGLLDLYHADFDPLWLKRAVDVAAQMIELFEDKQTGGFYLTGSDAPQLVVRNRGAFDGAIPSGNSAAAMELFRLGELTGSKKWTSSAVKVLEYYQDDMKNQPLALTDMLLAVDFRLGPRAEIVIAAQDEQAETQELLKHLHKHFLPRTVILLKDSKANAQQLENIAEPVKERISLDGKPAVYICEEFACREPITDIKQFDKALRELR
jgi:uncharacterized protein YyaL (SSP411 family)